MLWYQGARVRAPPPDYTLHFTTAGGGHFEVPMETPVRALIRELCRCLMTTGSGCPLYRLVYHAYDSWRRTRLNRYPDQIVMHPDDTLTVHAPIHAHHPLPLGCVCQHTLTCVCEMWSDPHSDPPMWTCQHCNRSHGWWCATCDQCGWCEMDFPCGHLGYV